MTDRLRCPAVKDFPAASVSNGDGMPPIERRQSGTLIHRLFWLPEAATREHPLLVNCGSSEAEIHRQLAVTQTAKNINVNVGYGAVRLTFARPAVDQVRSCNLPNWQSVTGAPAFDMLPLNRPFKP
jgi:hypothetical protein